MGEAQGFVSKSVSVGKDRDSDATTPFFTRLLSVGDAFSATIRRAPPTKGGAAQIGCLRLGGQEVMMQRTRLQVAASIGRRILSTATVALQVPATTFTGTRTASNWTPRPRRAPNAAGAARSQLAQPAGLYQWLRPFVVGLVHGLAGSAAIALIVLLIRPQHQPWTDTC